MNLNSPKLSRRTLLQLSASTCAATLAQRAAPTWAQDKPHENQPMFQNPLFAGDYADPTILRVGEDFYATHTSYQYAPGLVIWHSRDLVNWTHIANALPRTYGEVWAPDMIEHNGRFYIYYPQDAKLFVVYADDPKGPWSEPVNLKVDSIDPGHVVAPDGTRYLHFSGGGIIQLSADGLSTVGEKKHIYDGWQFPKAWKTEGFWLESPKLTKRGDYYYLICAEGGTAGPPTSHMAVVARAKSPLGPFENSPHNPLIHTYDEDEPWWSVGHGTLVSTPDNRWYFVYHGYRNGFPTLGRHTLMESVEWTEAGWPVAPLGAQRGEPMPAPMDVAQQPMIGLSDDFRAPVLKATWGAWNETEMSRFQTGNGALIIRAKSDAPAKSSPLTIMARDTSYSVQVLATPEKATAALGLFYNVNHWLWIAFTAGQLRVVDEKKTLAQREWKAATAHLKIINRQNRVEFLASENGRDWQSLASDVDVSTYQQNVMGGFQALRPALAASGVGTARFENFVYHAL